MIVFHFFHTYLKLPFIIVLNFDSSIDNTVLQENLNIG